MVEGDSQPSLPVTASERWPEPTFYSRLSTGLKMLLILSLALLPLGLIAVFASRESAHANRLRHEAEARAAATATAAAISETIGPATAALRQTVSDVAASARGHPIDQQQCHARLDPVAGRFPATTGIAIFDSHGRLVCKTSRFVSVPAYLPSTDIGYEVRLAAADGVLVTTVGIADGRLFGVAEFPAALFARLLPSTPDAKPGAILRQGSQSIVIQGESSSNPLDQIVGVTVPVAGGQLGLEMRLPAAPLSTADLLLILLPILMWAAGGAIGWIVLDRLLLRPLGQMQRAIGAFSRGEGPLILPRLKTPAREIRDLGESFEKATQAIRAHEQELAEGLDNQKRLTREVHHRVKNNLQVVSSLINLHSRGATGGPVLEAYASIQRRVDALAVVHRNHYAELEEHQGISLRALIGEIASNLRASATAEAARINISLSIVSASASQDTAVPIAFLITEIVELIMLCGPDSNIAISVSAIPGRTDRALLSISSPSLTSSECSAGGLFERFERVAGGLARQLRAPLQHDIAHGRYSIEIAILTA